MKRVALLLVTIVLALLIGSSAQAKAPKAKTTAPTPACKVLTPGRAGLWAAGATLDPGLLRNECRYSDQKPPAEQVLSVNFDYNLLPLTLKGARTLFKVALDSETAQPPLPGTTVQVITHPKSADQAFAVETRNPGALVPYISTYCTWRKGRFVGHADVVNPIDSGGGDLSDGITLMNVLLKHFP